MVGFTWVDGKFQNLELTSSVFGPFQSQNFVIEYEKCLFSAPRPPFGVKLTSFERFYCVDHNSIKNQYGREVKMSKYGRFDLQFLIFAFWCNCWIFLGGLWRRHIDESLFKYK